MHASSCERFTLGFVPPWNRSTQAVSILARRFPHMIEGHLRAARSRDTIPMADNKIQRRILVLWHKLTIHQTSALWPVRRKWRTINIMPDIPRRLLGRICDRGIAQPEGNDDLLCLSQT